MAKDIDKKSLEKAYKLFESKDIDKFEIGTLKGLPAPSEMLPVILSIRARTWVLWGMPER